MEIEFEDHEDEELLPNEFFYLVMGFFGLSEALNLSLIYAGILPGTILPTTYAEFKEFADLYLPHRIKKRIYFEPFAPEETAVAHTDFMYKYKINLNPKARSLSKFLANDLIHHQFLKSACPGEAYDEDLEGYEVHIAATLSYNPEQYVTIWSEACKNYKFKAWQDLAEKYQRFCLDNELPILISFLVMNMKTGVERTLAAEALDGDIIVFETVTD